MIYEHEALRAETERLARDATHVRINTARLQQVAEVMREELTGNGTPYQSNPEAPLERALPENNRDALQLYFVLSSQEFLIWRRNSQGQVQAWDIEVDGQRYVGGPGIAAAHARALHKGKPLLDADHLASMTMSDIESFYRDEGTGEVTLQMLPQRLAKLNEIGRVLRDRYDGHVSNLLREAEGCLFREDGRGIVQQLQLNFPIAYFDWPFCKLAILFAKFLVGRRKTGFPTTDEYRALTEIRDTHHFEIAADYYIPLFFLRTGIFELSSEFGRQLREQKLIERNSRMEFEFRAATMVAGRLLSEATGCPINDIDSECWKMGYLRCRLCREDISDEELPCPYRELSVAYQEQPSLMDMRWPLVLTTCY